MALVFRNSQLENSSVSYGGVSLSLGGTDATPAFNLQDATGYATSALVGTITNAQLAGSISNDKLAGSIANNKLANSSVSFGGVSVALGAADATPAFDLQDATGLPVASGISGMGTGIATFLATPSSANLISAVTNETGTGALVFGTSPALTTPNIGTPSAGTLTSCTGLPIATGVSGLGANVATFLGTASSANLRAVVTDETGTGSLVFSDAPTLVTPALGTPSSGLLSNCTTGTPATDAALANKAYVDNVAQGLDIKESVKAATTANITLSGTQTIDGVAILGDDRVLVKNQTTGSQNGIYLCKAGAWARAADFAAGDDEAGAFTFVEQGTTQADAGFVCTNNKGGAVVGTDNLVFSQFSGAGSVDAGQGIAKSGNVLSADLMTNGGLVFNGASPNGKIQIDLSGASITGSLPDSKLSNIVTAGKVQGSALQLASGKGLENDGGIAVKLTGTSLAFDVGTGGLKASAITNAEIAVGANIALDKLAAVNSAQIIVGTGTNKAAAVNLSGDVSITNAGVSTVTGVQANAVNSAGIQNSAVTLQKLGIQSGFESSNISNSSTSTFVLAQDIAYAEFRKGAFLQAWVNGQRLKYVNASPADNSEYTAASSGGSTTVTFGNNLVNGDVLMVSYWY